LNSAAPSVTLNRWFLLKRCVNSSSKSVIQIWDCFSPSEAPFQVGRDNFCHVHVSLVPTVGAVGEQKSKPIQHSVRELRAGGLSPDIIVCRSAEALSRAVQQKISL
jgi:hypothetical protein